MSQKYNRIIDDAVTEVSIEKSCYNDKSRYYGGISEPHRNHEISLYLVQHIAGLVCTGTLTFMTAYTNDRRTLVTCS